MVEVCRADHPSLLGRNYIVENLSPGSHTEGVGWQCEPQGSRAIVSPPSQNVSASLGFSQDTLLMGSLVLLFKSFVS